jgi:hypothetical protein
MNGGVWRIDRDASIETPVNRRNGIIFDSLPDRFSARSGESNLTVMGTEIVLSPPFSLENGSETLLDEIQKLFSILMEMGERPRNRRAGIHIHVASPMSINYVKTLIAVGAHLEDMFFLLGTQGYQYRGELLNDNAYCRPITKYGPPYMPSSAGDGRWGPIFDIDGLLQAKNLKEFWWRCGNTDMNRDAEHMNQVRYNWLNWYSLLAHQTVECRVFNTTLNPFLVYSEILFFQAFVKYCVGNSMMLDDASDLRKLFPENSVYVHRPRIEVLNSFNSLTDRMKLPNSVRLTLGDLLSTAPEVVLPEQRIKSHILQTTRGRGRSQNFSELGVKFVPEELLKTADIVDIHTIRGESR